MTEVTDAEDKPTQQVTDLLVNMYFRQAGHMQEYNEIYRKRGHIAIDQRDWGNINDPRVQLKIRETSQYVIEELMEAINLLKNKPWKQSLRDTDPDTFYKELADTWHFWLELLILAGMTPDKVQKYYFGIAENNDKRRAEGY